MHILVVSNHVERKKNDPAAGIFVERQIASLRRIGVTVSTFDIGTSHSPVYLLHQINALQKAAQDLHVDIVHARYGTIVAFVSIFSGKPVVITFAGSDLLPGASVSKVQTYAGILMSNFASLFASALICVSEELRQALWWRKNSATVIPDGVDLHLFTPGDQANARRRLGWQGNHPIVLISAARDPENKGMPLAQEAMEFVQIAMPNAELKNIQGIHPRDMPLYYRAADVLVSASRQEGSPNVIKEALACNLPVISSPVGDAKERLAGVYPSYVIPRDSRLMGNALIEVLKMRQRSNGRQHVTELGLENIALQVKEVYSSVIKNVQDV